MSRAVSTGTLVLVEMLSVIASPLLHADSAASGGSGPCASGRPGDHLASLFHQGRHTDAHALAMTLATVCPDAVDVDLWRRIDALSLLRLEDTDRARVVLRLNLVSGRPAERNVAATLLAWSHILERDTAAFASALERTPSGARQRLEALATMSEPERFSRLVRATLPADQAREAIEVARAYDEASRTKRPWLAGTLSGLIPGAGQAYAGSWQAAAVAFLLNAAFIGATVELAHQELYATAVAAGVAGSFFYVGNILSAADLAHRRNEQAMRPFLDTQQRLLLPESYP